MPLVGSPELRSHALMPQRIQIGRGALHARPHRSCELAISGVTVVLGDEEDELTARIMLRNRVGTAPVDDSTGSSRWGIGAAHTTR